MDFFRLNDNAKLKYFFLNFQKNLWLWIRTSNCVALIGQLAVILDYRGDSSLHGG
jgi:hypothetical protein